MPKSKTIDLPGLPDDPGVKPIQIEELEKAIYFWRGAVEERMKLTKVEVESRNRVITLMHEHNLTEYSFDDGDRKVKLVQGKEKVKCVALDDESGGEEQSE